MFLHEKMDQSMCRHVGLSWLKISILLLMASIIDCFTNLMLNPALGSIQINNIEKIMHKMVLYRCSA